MGIFGRKRRSAQQSRGRHAAPEPEDITEDVQQEAEEESTAGATSTAGPFDLADAPADDIARMDLGSVRIPIPDNAEVQVEMDPNSGAPRAVHVITVHGQVTISAYAAPRSGELWKEIASELATQLKTDGGRVSTGQGEWGVEISAIVGEVSMRLIGVDGPRWMLRGIISGPPSEASAAPETLRSIMRNTIVDRGDSPMPVRTPLSITLPEAVTEHIAQQQAQQS